ncbi:hypothetical protein [Pseudidiomarina taiwanensis]|uniref:ABC transmembrane type-1 domain-containing protein n=1 Tax=Pseudidiomarina taiwanensis TaxID=337250 RepID=A0A432ZN54_9GAMM|nr:hypothetical protein [Pseudidiomarina taiwanensis]RUO79291.1 hypothetical protein CWI83_01905 [Pseudidiomarina taiwanensis]
MARSLPIIVATSWVGFCLVLPVLGVLLLIGDGLWRVLGRGAELLSSFFEVPGLLSMVGQSLGTALISVFISFVLVLLTLPHTLQRSQSWFARVLIGMPHLVVAIGLVWLLAPTGWLWRVFGATEPSITLFEQQSLISLWLVLVLKEFPFLWLVAGIALKRLPVANWFVQGRALGRTDAQIWWLVVVPAVVRQLRLALIIVAVYSASVVDVALLLGPQSPPLFAVQVYQWFMDFGPQRADYARWGSILLLALSLLLVGIVVLHERVFLWLTARGLSRSRVLGLPPAWLPQVMLTVLLCLLVLIVFQLLILTGARGWFFPQLWPASWELQQVLQTVQNLAPTILSSFLLAAVVSVLATVTVVLLTELQRHYQKQVSLTLVLLPLLLPQIILLLGWQSAYFLFSNTPHWAWIVLCHLPFSIAYTFIVYAPIEALYPQRTLVVAQSLGHSYWQAWWRLKARSLARVIGFSFGFAAVIALAQYLPVQMTAAGRVQTLTTEFVSLASGGIRPEVVTIGLVLTLVSFIALSLQTVKGDTQS